MKGGATYKIGILVVILVFILVMFLMLCVSPVNKESLFCKPVEPFVSIVESIMGL